MSEEQNNNTTHRKKKKMLSLIIMMVSKTFDMQGYENRYQESPHALYVTADLLLLGEILSMSMSNLEWTPLVIGIVVLK